MKSWWNGSISLDVILSFDPLLANSKHTVSDSFEFVSVPDIDGLAWYIIGLRSFDATLIRSPLICNEVGEGFESLFRWSDLSFGFSVKS